MSGLVLVLFLPYSSGGADLGRVLDPVDSGFVPGRILNPDSMII